MDRPSRVKVTLFSGHQLILQELRLFLSPRFDVKVSKLNSGISALQALRIPKGRVCVVDGNEPKSMLEALVGSIINTQPNARVVVLLEQLTEAEGIPLLQLGARGLMAYETVKSQLPRAVRMVAHGGYWVPRELMARFVELILRKRSIRPISNLLISTREQQVLSHLADNLSNKEIASALNISERTVKFHVSNLLAKFSVQRRADLILLSYQNSEAAERSRPLLLSHTREKRA